MIYEDSQFSHRRQHIDSRMRNIRMVGRVSTGVRQSTPFGKEDSELSLARLAVYVPAVFFLFFINKLGLYGNVVCYGTLCLMAAHSNSGAIKALLFTPFVIFGNPSFVEVTTIASFGRFLVLGIAGLRLGLFLVHRGQLPILMRRHLVLLFLFGFIAAILAPINGYYTTISLVKLFAFMLGAFTFLLYLELEASTFKGLASWFVSLMVLLVLASYLTIPLGVSRVVRLDIMYAGMMGHVGMSGMFNHPQVLGTLVGISAVALFALALYGKISHRYILWALFLLILPLMYLTRSRTAMGTLVAGITIVMLLSPVVQSRVATAFRRISLGKIFAGAVAIGFVALLVDLFGGGGISSSAMSFILKHSSSLSGSFEVSDLLRSRERLLTATWNNFLSSPLTGINFGTAYTPGFINNATLLSAPAEKGFIFTAVLEEVGIVGFAAFMAFIVATFSYLYASRNVFGIILLSAFLVTNLGEMIFFSLGGTGMYCWALFATMGIIGKKHIIADRTSR